MPNSYFSEFIFASLIDLSYLRKNTVYLYPSPQPHSAANRKRENPLQKDGCIRQYSPII